MKLCTLLLCFPIALATPIHADVKAEPPREEGKEAAPAKEGNDQNKEKPPSQGRKSPETSTTKHTIVLSGVRMEYTATAGTLPIRDAEGKTKAEIFYIAYTKDGLNDLSQRPVTFSFNGGPGSSSVWMHLGLLGPRRVKLQDDGSAVPPPYQLVDNEYSLLDETDLVFIDPVGTGYSRATKPEDAKLFFGLAEDARSVAEFIRLYVTQNTRWASPKFLIGESYGTTRAAALSGELANKHRMNLNGIMLVSTVLNFQTIWGGEGNDLPHVLYLPSYTATAWHHRKLPEDLQKLPIQDVLKQAEAFAVGEYLQAIMLGAALPDEQRKAVLEKMARFTGVSADWLDRANLRPGLERFSVELLRDRRLQVGRFDSRYTGHVRNGLASSAEGDPSGDAFFAPFASTFNHFIRTELKYIDDQPYEILASLGKWNWGAENDFVNVAETLAVAMTRNPFLKVHVSCGYTDLATPYFASHYTFKHLNVAPEISKNITIDDYYAGHMMYLNLPDLAKQRTDLGKFIRAATGR
ncbi:peptidase S10 [Roseimicrobium sp. ORNL1]|uniref:S10 family peptidase n=1 Tax=Roseimicrobium sp. ORNL1 TaxID=2711231 RepID=UPI0013E1E772|nr:peptidase S10 [Roseimicrobium sp. ORNL1]QIF05093.1 peptidase S10 [Roseimicrobium sp. ORNL1]